MLKKCNRILAFLLALVLVITTFKSDFNELRVFADEGDEITVDAPETEETELPSIFEKVDETPVVTEDAVVTDSENQNDQVEEIVEENNEDENTEEVAEEVAEEEAEEAETEEETEEVKEEVTEEVKEEVAMDLPFFADTTIAEDGIKISLYAAENVLPNDAELEVVKVQSSLEEKIAETIDGETGDDLEVEKTYSYDINIKSESAGGYVQPEDGTVKVTFENIVAAESEDTSLAVYHVETSGDEVTNVTEIPSNSEDTTDVSIDAAHFSIYTVTVFGFGNNNNSHYEFYAGVYDVDDGTPITKENSIRKVRMDEIGYIEYDYYIQSVGCIAASKVAPIMDGYTFDHATLDDRNVTYFVSTDARVALEDNSLVSIPAGTDETIKFFYKKADLGEYKTSNHIDLGFTDAELPSIEKATITIEGKEFDLVKGIDESDLKVKELRLSLPAGGKDGYISEVSSSNKIIFTVYVKGNSKPYIHESTEAENKNAYERCINAHTYRQNEFGFDYKFNFATDFNYGASVTYHSNFGDDVATDPYSVKWETEDQNGQGSHTLLTYDATKLPANAHGTFLGWGVKNGETVTLTYEFKNGAFNPASVDVNNDDKIDLYAVWNEEPQYTITFKGYYYEDAQEKKVETLGTLKFYKGETLTVDDAIDFVSDYCKDYEFDSIYVDSGLTREFQGITSVKANQTLHARFRKGNDNKVYYFLLGVHMGLKDPNEGRQPVEDYYPDKNNAQHNKYIWTGEANDIDAIDPKYISYKESDGYKSVYNWTGIDNNIVGYSYDEGIDDKISSYVENKYGDEFDLNDVIWYVFKKHRDGNHIDGYVSSFVTYHANLPASEIYEDKLTHEDERARFGTNKIVLENSWFTAKNPNYEFLGWDTNPDLDPETETPEYTVADLAGEVKPTVLLDKKVHLYGIWKKADAPYKLIIKIQSGSEGDDVDKTVVYDGSLHYGGVKVTVDAHVIADEGFSSKVKKAVSRLLSLGVLTVHAADYPKEETPVDAVDIEVTEGLTVHVAGIKEIADPGLDVGDYDVNLDYSGMTITTQYEGKTVDVKDLFVVEIEGKKSTGEETETESNPEKAKEKDTEVVAQLHVVKRNVVLSSGSASKVYDGTALTKDGVSVSGDGWANGNIRGQEGATYNVTGSQTAVGSSGNPFTYTLKPENTFAGNYNITVNYGTLRVTPVSDDNPPPPEENPPTITPPAEGQVLGAVRPVDGAAVLGARRGRTEDSANTLGRIITIIVAAGIGFTMIFIKRKKNEE